jgi:DNA-directed RNA polymerase beta' subunit
VKPPVESAAMPWPRLSQLVIVPLEDASVRARAPSVVRAPGTYDRRTWEPFAGGLFDEQIFGVGAELNRARAHDDEPATHERARRFGRISLGEPVPHPLDGRPLCELLVLPPDLRPLLWHNGELLMSEINTQYQRVVIHENRRRRLVEIGAPTQLVDNERQAVAQAVAALLDNERQQTPLRDDTGRVLRSLRSLLRPDAEAALHTLDQAVVSGAELGALPMRLHRTVSTLLALGFDVLTKC